MRVCCKIDRQIDRERERDGVRERKKSCVLVGEIGRKKGETQGERTKEMMSRESKKKRGEEEVGRQGETERDVIWGERNRGKERGRGSSKLEEIE